MHANRGARDDCGSSGSLASGSLLMNAKTENILCIDRRHAYRGNKGARNDRGSSSSVASDSSLMDAKTKNILCIDRRHAYRGGG